MRKLLLFALSLALVSSTALTAAYADDSDDSDGGSMLRNMATFPIKTVAVLSGLTIGVPIATIRYCTMKYKDYTNEMADKIGGHEYFPPVLFASVLGIPAGLVVGTGEGIYFGTRNALGEGCEKPFCKESFSLRDIN